MVEEPAAKEPAAHGVQANAATPEEKDPAAQPTGTAAPSGHALPRGHATTATLNAMPG